jgi:transporter family protein
MWVLFAFGSALFAGITSILAKSGIRNVDSNVATAIRTIVVLVFAWLMAFVTGAVQGLSSVDSHSMLFLILSGLATGASWLCYFRALQIGDINKVVPIDKSSTILTMLLAFLLLGEPVTIVMAICIVAIGAGTYLMVGKKRQEGGQTPADNRYLLFAVLSAVFASLTAILGKIGISGVNSNLGTAIRTCVVLLMAWIVVFIMGKQGEVRNIPKKDLLFISLSGVATGASWLCYYRALQLGPASVVVPIDKLSIVATVLFSYLVFREKLSKKEATGLFLIVAGTLALLWK